VKTAFKVIISFALAAAILFSLSSCVTINTPKKAEESTADAPESESAGTEYDYKKVENNFIEVMKSYLFRLGDADFGGASFLIAAPNTSLIDGEGKGLAMSEEILLRNRDVEDKLNVKISSKLVDVDTLYDTLRSTCMTNDFFADAVMIPQYCVHQFAAAGILFNFNTLPFADFESDFNIKSGVEAAMANSTGWALGGWSTLDEDSLPAVFFNKALVRETGLGDPYELVRNGKWTWDAFFAYTAALPSLDEGLLYSYGCESISSSLADAVYFSEGNRFITSGLGTYPAVAMDGTALAHTVNTERALFGDDKKVMNPSEAIEIFADGGSMFLIDRLGTMKTICTSKAVWGVLPMPKQSEEQAGYCSLVGPEALMLAVPANSTGAEKVSRVTAAMNICSLGSLVDAYLQDCMYYYLRDNDSIDSVEAICYGAVWDMAYSAGGYDDSIPNATYYAIRNVSEGNGEIQEYIDNYAYGASVALSGLFP